MKKQNHMLTKKEMYKSTSVNNLDIDTKKDRRRLFFKKKKKKRK